MPKPCIEAYVTSGFAGRSYSLGITRLGLSSFISSCGISSRKRDGRFIVVSPNMERVCALTRYSFCRARVMPT